MEGRSWTTAIDFAARKDRVCPSGRFSLHEEIVEQLR